MQDLHQNHYLWDNWLVIDPRSGIIYRYVLQASRELERADRHFHAEIAVIETHRESAGQFKNKKHSIVFPATDEYCYWTGSSIFYDNRFYLFFTETEKASGFQRIKYGVGSHPAKIEMANSYLIDFNNQELWTQAKNLGYDKSFQNKYIMACRDPYVFYDSNQELWLMYFAAKAINKNGQTVGAVGVAKSKNLASWELQSPIILDVSGELEVPICLLSQGKYQLFISVYEKLTDGTENRRIIHFTRGGPDEDWVTQGTVFNNKQHIYGLTLKQNPFSSENNILMGGFYNDTLRLTKLFETNIDGIKTSQILDRTNPNFFK